MRGLPAFIVFSMLVFPGLVFAGPFGTEMGDQVSKYPDAQPEKEKPGTYTVTKVPKHHPVFDSYELVFGETGLNEVTARSHPADKGAMRDAFEKIIYQLNSKYGKGTCKESGIYTTVTSYCIWHPERDNIRMISLDLTKPVSKNVKEELSLTYEYMNHNKLHVPSEIDSL